MKYTFSLLFFLFLLSNCSPKNEIPVQSEVIEEPVQSELNTLVFKGTVLDSTPYLIIIDPLSHSERIGAFYTNDNHIEFTWEAPEYKRYSLTPSLGESYNYVNFYPDQDTIFFTVDENSNISIEAGEESKNYNRLAREYAKKLEEEKQPIIDQYGDNEGYETINNRIVALNPISQQKQDLVSHQFYINYLKERPKQIRLSDFDLFLQQTKWRELNSEEIGLAEEKYKFLSDQLKNDYYDSAALSIINTHKNEIAIDIGSNYKNIQVQDIDGNLQTLDSEIQENEYVLLDIWATWCSACRYKSEDNISIYEKYQDKGFEVFNVMFDVHQDSEETYRKIANNLNYPWAVYVDLTNKVEELYGIRNGGGEMFLINKKGEILKIGPSPKELNAYLAEHLK